MPELPEVQTVVDSLARLLSSGAVPAGGAGIAARLDRVAHLRQDMVSPGGFDLAAAVRGRQVASVTRRGKRVVFELDDGGRFFVHLGMTGRLTVEPASAPLRPHTHLILSLADGRQVRFVDPRRFGRIVWLGAAAGDDAMGPEPLTLRPARLHRLLQATRRAVKTALLDQRVIAGIGNIYADEALFAAGIHPLRPACGLSAVETRRLAVAIKRVLRRAIRHRGSSLRDYVDGEGKPGGFQLLHRVYARGGQKCSTCKAEIQRLVVGGRSTCFCPACQPGGKSARR